jgi:TM2 domain-containing membrane protein YozV
MKSRLAFILLGLFVGALGIHNFYAGYTGRGVAQLLITLLIGWLFVPLIFVGIWILIEIITVTADSDGVKFGA